MTIPTYQQLSDPTQSGPGFVAENWDARLLTILAILASGQYPDGTPYSGGGGGGGGVPQLIAIPDNGALNSGNAASLNAQMNYYAGQGYNRVFLPAGLGGNAYGLESQLIIPVGIWLDGDGPLTFRNTPSGTALTPGSYYGTAFVPAVGWTDPGFDIRQDTDTSLGGTSTVSFSTASSTIIDSAILASDVGRPVTGYGVTSNTYSAQRFVGTVTPGVSFVLVDKTGAAQTPVTEPGGITSFHCVTIGTNLPLGGLVTLATTGTGTGSGNAITNCTINGTNVNGTTKVNTSLYVLGLGSTLDNLQVNDGLVGSILSSNGDGTDSSQDSAVSRISVLNKQVPVITTLTATGGGPITMTQGSPILSNINPALLSPLASAPFALNGAIGSLKQGGYMGAMIVGTGVSPGTFVLQGGVNANGPGTLLCSQNFTQTLTASDVTIVATDAIGLALRVAGSDWRIHSLRIAQGTLAITGADCIVTGGNIFGTDAAPVALNPIVVSAASVTTGTVTLLTGLTPIAVGETIFVVGLSNGSGGANWTTANGYQTVTACTPGTSVSYVPTVAPTGTATLTAPTVTATFVAGYAAYSQSPNYKASLAGSATQFTGTTFGPGPGKAFGAFVRLDAGTCTIAGGLLESNSLEINCPMFEDNCQSTTGGGFHINTTAKVSGGLAQLGAIVYRRDGNMNPRSIVNVVADTGAMATGAPLWTGTFTPTEISSLSSRFGTVGGQPGNWNVTNGGVLSQGPPAVLCATAAALPTYTGAGTGTLTATANGSLHVDTSATPIAGDSVAVTQAASAVDNGIYIVTASGGASTPWSMTRRMDMLQGAVFVPPVSWPVLAGTTYAGQIVTLGGSSHAGLISPVTIGTSSLTFGVS